MCGCSKTPERAVLAIHNNQRVRLGFCFYTEGQGYDSAEGQSDSMHTFQDERSEERRVGKECM